MSVLSEMKIDDYVVSRENNHSMDECMCAMIGVFHNEVLVASGYYHDLSEPRNFDDEVCKILEHVIEREGVTGSVQDVDKVNGMFCNFIQDALYDDDIRFERDSLEPMNPKDDGMFPPWSGSQIRYITTNQPKQKGKFGGHNWQYLDDSWTVDVFIKESKALYEEKKEMHSRHYKENEGNFIEAVAETYDVNQEIVRGAMESSEASMYKKDSLQKVVNLVEFTSKYLDR